MFRSIDDFAQAWTTHRESTLKILGALDDAGLGAAAAEGHRDLAGVAWHIVTAIPEMMARTGLPLAAVDPASPPPADAAAIRAGYDAVSAELLTAVRENWDDATLAVTDDMYGETWPRGVTLAILKDHEIHHRGQMTTLMRLAGLKVPGVCGPAKEEWKAFGMEEPPY